jgi:hypothetical protein
MAALARTPVLPEAHPVGALSALLRHSGSGTNGWISDHWRRLPKKRAPSPLRAMVVTRHRLRRAPNVSRHRKWSSKKPYRAFRIAAWSARLSGGSPARRMSASISLSRSSTITHRKFRLRRWRCRRMRVADAAREGSVSAADVSSVPGSLAIIVLPPGCRVTRPNPMADRRRSPGITRLCRAIRRD